MVDLTFFRSGQLEHMGTCNPFLSFYKTRDGSKGSGNLLFAQFSGKTAGK